MDNWHVLGPRGTGSHDFTAEDVFVPREHTLDIFLPTKQRLPLPQ